jgi:hypothetical protein
MTSDDYIDMDEFDKFCRENPPHFSPEAILEMALEMVEGEEYAALHADVQRLVDKWGLAEVPVPEEVRHFEADALLARHGFAPRESEQLRS